MRYLGHQISGSRCHNNQIIVSRQPDMADILLILEGKQFGKTWVVESEATASSVVNSYNPSLLRASLQHLVSAGNR